MSKLKDKQLPYDVSVCILTQLVSYLKHLNLDIHHILLSLGIDAAILSNPEGRISFENYVDIENEAARISGDSYFGLHMGEFFDVGNWSILGYMMMNCHSLGEAFEKYGRYSRIVGNLITWSFQHMNWKTIKHSLSTDINSHKLSRHCFETAMASIVKMARLLCGSDVRIIEVGFAFPKPESTEEYERFFCCPVFFEQKEYYIVVDSNMGKLLVKQPNAVLLEHFENYAQKYLSFDDVGPISSNVLKLVLLHLDGRSLNISKIAKEMAIDKRTLQNKLWREGTTFSKLLNQTRMHLAKKLLYENCTVEEITYRLGFSDPSVFRKSFKKWVGSTPKEYRLSISQ